MINHVLKKCFISPSVVNFFSTLKHIKESDELSQEEIDNILGNTPRVEETSSSSLIKTKSQ